MKKIFAQPEITVVNIKNNDIVTDSRRVLFGTGTKSGSEACSPGLRTFEDWDAGY
ncbi:MAG: hypothetical protein J6T19_08465 [Paludibacteraceae bacterium]|jgi:hypothetical protein|nr:hypothetical protein [Paludibacteraceae bacterium]